MTATDNRLDELTDYLKLGWYLLPIWPVNRPDNWPRERTHTCACGRSDCDRPGKHPLSRLVPNGVDGASNDPTVIREWLAEWPDCNWAVALAKSGLVDIAPDSPEWLTEFERRGLPTTFIFESGGGPGHRHYLYPRPADCPTHRVCKSGAYDILSNGFALIPPGLHSRGARRKWMISPQGFRARFGDELPPVPTWAVAELMTAATKTERAPINESGDEPPVRLSPQDMKWWTGEWFAAKPGGGVDRSESHWAIAKILAGSNATGSAIAAALANRDRALGWNKYSGRTDAGTRYRETAARAIAEAATEHAMEHTFSDSLDDHQPRDDDGGDCGDRIAGLRAEIDQLSARIREMEEQRTYAARTLRNQKLQSARVTAVALVNEVDWLLSRGKADAEGFVKIVLGGAKDPVEEWQGRGESNGLADKSGISRSTASRHVKKFDEWDFLDRKIDYKEVPIVDHATGEVVGRRLQAELKVRLHDTPSKTLAKFATFEPDEPTHGGDHRHCKHHPHAKLKLRTTIERLYTCVECGEVVDQVIETQESIISPGSEPENPHVDAGLQDATTGDRPPCGRTSMSQHATPGGDWDSRLLLHHATSPSDEDDPIPDEKWVDY